MRMISQEVKDAVYEVTEKVVYVRKRCKYG